jgi:hypothetical protein
MFLFGLIAAIVIFAGGWCLGSWLQKKVTWPW